MGHKKYAYLILGVTYEKGFKAKRHERENSEHRTYTKRWTDERNNSTVTLSECYHCTWDEKE